MVFISATRLRVQSWLFLPAFFFANEASARALTRTPGFLKGKELIDKNLTFWTLTIWQDGASMKAFRNSAAHRKAMQRLPAWCNEASYAHWTEGEARDIDWQTVHARMTQEGKLSKVRRPSQRQLDNRFPPPQWTLLQRPFKPAGS